MKKTAETQNDLLEEDLKLDEEPDIAYRKWAKIGIYALCSFLFAQLDFFYGLSPFSVAFVGAISCEYSFAAFVGGALGAFTCLPLGQALRLAAAIFAVSLFKAVKGRYLRNVQDGYIDCVVAFCVCFVSGIVYNYLLGGDTAGIILILGESIAAFLGVMVFIKSFRTPVARMGVEELSVKDGLCLGMACCAFLMCASCFDVEGLSPVRILAFLLILFVGAHKGISGSVTVGICVALSLSINEDYRFLFTAVAIGSLASGMFSPLGQSASAIAFALFTSGISAFSGDYGIVCLIEAVIVSAVFIILPSKYVAAFENFIRKKGLAADDRIAGQVAESLNGAAENIYGVSEIVAEVSDKLDSVINPEVNRLFSFLQQGVCDGCQRKFLCWNRNFDETASDVLTVAGIEKNGKIRLKKNCPRFSQLSLQIDEGYKDYAESLQTKMKLREMRKVLTDQFTGMGDFLKSTALAVSESRIPDKGKAAVLKTAFSDSGIYVDSLSCYTNIHSKITVEITSFDSDFHEHHKKMKGILEFITKRRFEKADITVTEIKTVIVFEEKSALRVQVGVSQKPLKEENVCGDSVAVVKKRNGFTSVVLSDGMGTGARAKIDSAMTCSIMEKLLQSDFSFDCALKIVNSLLIMKSTDESIATIDALKVNLFTGKVNFYKAGATLTFIRRGNEITVLEAPSLPVGIIRNVEFFKSEKELSVGDIVLMLSDGAVGEDCGWIHDELLSWNTANMDDLACHIVRLAHLRMTDKNRDDITAVAVKINRNLQ